VEVEAAGIAPTPDGHGYWVVGKEGHVFAFGSAYDLGGLPELGLQREVAGIAPTPDGQGYWIAGRDGAVFTFGNASYLGGFSELGLRIEAAGIASTPEDQGYWIAARNGGVYTFGNAVFCGSLHERGTKGSVATFAPTRDGLGYWIVGRDGSVEAFGNASDLGDLSEFRRRIEVVGFAPAPDGQGYLLVAPSGIVFPFGIAALHESGARTESALVVGIAVMPAPDVPKLFPRPATSVRFPWTDGWLNLPAMPDPEVSIVIPVHGHSELTAHCLRSIAERTANVRYEVIVVDDASPDDTPAMLRCADGIHVITNPTNVGFLHSCNRGAQAARGSLLVFLNNDTVVREGWLEALVQTVGEHPDAGVVGGRVVVPNGGLQEAGCIVWRDGTAEQYGCREDPERPEFNFVREVDYCSGACLLVRRELFEATRGFDERFAPAYYEDVDLAFEARDRGYRVLFQPGAVIEHHEGSSYGGDEARSKKRKLMPVHRERFVTKWEAAIEAQRPKGTTTVQCARQRSTLGQVVVFDHTVPTWDRDAGSLRMLRLLGIFRGLGFGVTLVPAWHEALQPYTNTLQQLGIEVYWREAGLSEHLAGLGDQVRLVVLSRPEPAWHYLRLIRSVLPRVPIIYDTVDLHFRREARRAELDRDSGAAAASAVLQEQELALVRLCDATLVVTAEERDVLQALLPAARVLIVPTIHEVSATTRPFEARKDLLFVGSFRHPPNVDAVTWFVESVMPHLRKNLPGVRFVIAGGDTDGATRALATDDVEVVGWIEDLMPLHQSARVFVAPLRFGAGMKGKIGESLAYGLPVVTTSVGAEGFDSDESGLVIADEARAFADAVGALYRDPHQWARAASAGRDLIETRFSIDATRTRIIEVLGSLGIGIAPHVVERLGARSAPDG
jgi:GT2 family glycosyltransferase